MCFSRGGDDYPDYLSNVAGVPPFGEEFPALFVQFSDETDHVEWIFPTPREILATSALDPVGIQDEGTMPHDGAERTRRRQCRDHHVWTRASLPQISLYSPVEGQNIDRATASVVSGRSRPVSGLRRRFLGPLIRSRPYSRAVADRWPVSGHDS